jgi:hypothetical protein
MSTAQLPRKSHSTSYHDHLISTVEVRSIEFPEGGDHQTTYNVLYETARCYFVDALESAEEDRELKNGVNKFTELLGEFPNAKDRSL